VSDAGPSNQTANRIAMKEIIEQMLRQIGEDPTREGLARTPMRVEKSMQFLTAGYSMQLEDIINNALFEEACDEMVIVRDIDMYSMCEHHLLPFFGRCHVAYIPRKKIIGLSKIPRIVEMFSRRLQVQERMTNQIAQTLQDTLNPLGVGVVVEAQHLCMMMRGIQKQNTVVTTSCLLGAFRTDAETRAEFVHLVPSVR
jgi:GTP cyclohydrolase IA